MNSKTGKSTKIGLIMFITLLWGVTQIVPTVQASFYEGKTVRIVVGYSPGGGFDTFARLLGRHFGRHIPGNPRIIVQNMPGAASIVAANRVYAMQPGNGLTIVTFHFGMLTQALLKNPSIKFDPLKYPFLGSPSLGGLPQVLWVRSDLPIHSLEDLKKRKKPLAMASTGIGTGPAVLAEFLRSLGLPLKNVHGYLGSRDTMAALERKEADGRIISQSTMQSIYGRFIDEGLVRPILSLGKEPRLAPLRGIATEKDLNLNSAQLKMADFLTTTWALLRVYAVPPGTPPERLKALRDAFINTLKSPQLITEAERQGVRLAPISGEEVNGFIQKIYQTSPSIVERYKELLVAK